MQWSEARAVIVEAMRPASGRPRVGLLTCFATHRSHPKSKTMPDGHLSLPPLGQSTACERDQSKFSLSNQPVNLSMTAPSLSTEPREDMQSSVSRLDRVEQLCAADCIPR